MSPAAIYGLVIIGCGALVLLARWWFKHHMNEERARLKIDEARNRVDQSHELGETVHEHGGVAGFRWWRKCIRCGAAQCIDGDGASTDFRLIAPCTNADGPRMNPGGGYDWPDGRITSDLEGLNVIRRTR
jgi:hypothetical protein